MKFYNAGAPNPRKVRIFLAEKGLEIPRIDLDLGAGESRTPEFLAKNRLGETPVLELDDGTILTENNAICRFLEELHPDPPLFGRDALERAKVEMWTRRIEIQVVATAAHVAEHTFEFFASRRRQVPEFAEAERAALGDKLAWLDSELSDGRPFATGDRFTFADITGMTAGLILGFIDCTVPDENVHLRAYFERLKTRPSWDA